MNVCTIIAKNYLAYARVLAASFTRHHPDGRFWTLIIDDFAGRIDPDAEPFEVLTPAEIECEPFIEMAMRYSVLELSTAVKPWLLRHIMSETGAPVTYLDPDIRIYESLRLLDELAAAHGVVLIPHNSVPIPADGRKPSQVDIMIAGVYNLGYITVAPGQEVDGLLDWWAERLRRDCRVDPAWGYFVDQRWFDLAPGFLTDVAIMREPEYNVAYWNLHARRLTRGDRSYSVDGRPLRFFHFSGFDPEHPLVLSRYQNRIDVLADSVLEDLLSEYASEVLAAGHQTSQGWPYGYTALGDGTPLDGGVRALYDGFASAHPDVPSPFTPDGASEFVQWLAEEAPGAPGINRMLAGIYEDRPDLRGAYPNLSGVDRDRLRAWAQEYGRHEIPSLARTMMTAERKPGSSDRRATSGDSAQSDRPPSNGDAAETIVVQEEPSEPLRNVEWGVNVVGYFRSELGMGEAARQVVSALERTGIPVLPIHGETIPLSRQGHAYETATPADAVFPVNLICMNADALPEFAGQVGIEFFAGRYSVGLWFWEVSTFPSRWRGSFSLLEEVWAPTDHVAAALEPVATVPTHTVRIPVQTPSFAPQSREHFGLPTDEFTFLFSFDYLSVFKRKNPLAIIEAFARAFVPGEGAHLVLKCINHERDSSSHAELCRAAAEHADITVIDAYMSPSDKNALTAVCDCYVSLHRAEGFGLPMAEAMSLEKPVIATGYSGNLDFMTDSNSLLVDYRLSPIGPGAEPYPAEGEWAEPDVEHASTLMRGLFDDPSSARELGARAATDIGRTHSPQAAGAILDRRLESIRATGRAKRAVDQARVLPPTVRALPLRIRQGPVRPGSGKAGAARELARNTALRAMRPFAAYQQAINYEIVSALEELNGLLADVRTEAAADRARLLTQLRIERGTLTAMQESAIEELRRTLQLQSDRALYTAMSELRHRHAAIADRPGGPGEVPDLTSYELRAFSQNGEDGVLAEILRRVGVPTRSFVEFGVESGREGNCVYLADAAGWRGVFMEADEELYDALASKYAAQAHIRTAQALITPENVESTFQRFGVVPEPDVLSIDVDGQDYWIWEAIERYRPRVVIIEYNSALDPRTRLVQPNEPTREWDGSEFFGASLGALVTLGERKGYRLVHTELSGVNAFFVRSELVGDAFPEPEAVARRGAPNYFQTGYRHPAARGGRRYLDLDTGQLVGSTTL